MNLVIITGQLGAGKTTILNNIVNTLPNIKTSIIINEFAVIGVDKESISQKVEEVNAGCVCCSKGEELIDKINELSSKSKLILLETTGLASLGQLMKVVSTTKAKIVNVILVVDAYSYKHSKGFSQITKQQITSATTIIINKTDLVEKKVVDEIKKKLEGKEVIIARKGKVNYKQISKKHDVKVKNETSFMEKLIPELKLDKESKHIQKAQIKSISYTTKNKISKFKLENFMYRLPKEINRAKGIIIDDKTYKFNYSSGLFFIEENLKPRKEGLIILIGKMSRFQKLKLIAKLDELTGEKTTVLDKIKSFFE